MAEIRTLHQKLAVSGDALMLEALRQLSPEERKTALQAMKNKSRQKRQKHRGQKNK